MKYNFRLIVNKIKAKLYIVCILLKSYKYEVYPKRSWTAFEISLPVLGIEQKLVKSLFHVYWGLKHIQKYKRTVVAGKHNVFVSSPRAIITSF